MSELRFTYFRPLFLALPCALVLAACGAEKPETDNYADVVFTNGIVYTADREDHLAQAVAVKDGQILSVGQDSDISAYQGPATRLIDMQGRMLLPGFTDAHTHLIDGGETLTSLSLHAAQSVTEIKDIIAEYVKNHPDDKVIVGSGWSLPLFAGGKPNKAILDALEPQRPIIIYAADGHNAWVNSQALILSGITAETPDPENGVIDHDAGGSPSGTLSEAATLLVEGLLPPRTVEASRAQLSAAMSYQNSLGYTAAIDASIPPGAWEDAYIANAASGEMSLRVDLSLLPSADFTDRGLKTSDLESRIQELTARRARVSALNSPYLSANTVKIFTDGVLENQTSALIEPYVNSAHGPLHKGMLNIPADVLNSYVAALDQAHFQTHMHAIGDLAVRSGLNAISYAREQNPQWDRRPHIAHIELIDPIDIPRFKQFGVGANMQTLWAFADDYITDLTEPFIGQERGQWLYPNAALRDTGAFLVSGSDWPVSTSDPFDAIEVAVRRADPDHEGEAWLPQHALDVKDMLRALTINGAILMGQDKMRGSIETGKRADLILINANPLTIAPTEISEIEVDMTLVDGRIVYERLMIP